MNITEAHLKLLYEDMILNKFSDSNQIVKYLLRDIDDPISEAYAFFGKDHINHIYNYFKKRCCSY